MFSVGNGVESWVELTILGEGLRHEHLQCSGSREIFTELGSKHSAIDFLVDPIPRSRITSKFPSFPFNPKADVMLV
jgi:hypothetical protein